MVNAGTVNVTLPDNLSAPTYNPNGAQIQAMATPSGLNSGAWQAANIAGGSLGIDPNILYGQFKGETGNFSNSGSAVNNFGSIMPGGKMAAYQSPQDFAQAFTGLINRNFPNAIGSGSNLNQYVAGLTNGRIGTYYANPAGMPAESQQDYQNMIGSNMPNAGTVIPVAKPLSWWDKIQMFGGAFADNTVSFVHNPVKQVDKATTIVAGAVADKTLNLGILVFGGVLIAGAIFLGYKQAPSIKEVLK